MSEISSGNAAPAPVTAAGESSLRSMAILSYVLLLISCINGLTAIVAVIIAYIKKRDAAGTVWDSHMRNVILVFWVMLSAFLIGMLSFPISLGFFFAHDFTWPFLSALSVPFAFWLVIFPIFLIWFLYRTIRGVVRASENRSY